MGVIKITLKTVLRGLIKLITFCIQKYLCLGNFGLRGKQTKKLTISRKN